MPLRHLLLPILPIPPRHIDTAHIAPFQASIINIIPLGIAPRDRQRRDAASLTEHMLRSPRIERINLQMFFAVEGFERRFLDDEA